MPQVYLKVKWPDDQVQEVYSPSTIVHDYFSPGDKMTVDEFTEKCKTALNKASDRVAEKYGFACSSAMASLDSVIKKAHDLENNSDIVEVIDLN